MTGRAEAEKRLLEIEAQLSAEEAGHGLTTTERWLIAELRAAWAATDLAQAESLRERMAFSGPVFKRKLALAGIEHAGYRRGLAAARAALEQQIEEAEKDGESTGDGSWAAEWRGAIVVIDALAAAGEGGAR